jgi:bilirubin oxidase
VYAGPAGFYLLRGGEGDLPAGVLPSGRYEIPIVIQDRSFNADGSLFYPRSRAFFDGFSGPYAPFSDVPPAWNPEFFGNTMMVNGRTWPFLEVEARRYRLRLLNGAQSRFLVLTPDAPVPWTQIGGDGGFLPAPVPLERLLLGPAERADVIVDFTGIAPGTRITLLNLGPDEPFGGGEPDGDFDAADPATTGRVLQFRVVAAASADATTPADLLALPAPEELGTETHVRRLSLNEEMSAKVCVDALGRSVRCSSPQAADVAGPVAAKLGILDDGGNPVARTWMDPVTETPTLGATELWEVYNFTADAHPVHVHLVQFEIVNRQALATDADGISVAPAVLVGDPRAPEPNERGRKDTVVVYPGEVARFRARFDLPGDFVWHCHILEHEDNEMMRPFRVVAGGEHPPHGHAARP